MRTSTEWLRYFESNAGQLLDIPWERVAELTPDEIIAVGPSIAEFQRGESGEGRHLIRYAQKYAERTGDRDYAAAIILFIREEQRHARDLRRVLELHRIPLARASFADAVFRRLRNIFGTLEISIGVLITAELMAQVYYDALRQATRSQILQRLCEQILSDEARHVEFQAERLGILRAHRGSRLYMMTMAFQRILFWATSFVVWLAHRRVFDRGGLGFGRFQTEAWRCFEAAFAISANVRHACRTSVILTSGAPSLRSG
ncbi:MAG TPA: ferritin-like domain-containing protein [Gemmatimonadaceae bacterium]|jgi:hypothetical protein